jgi:hypothetical protein
MYSKNYFRKLLNALLTKKKKKKKKIYKIIKFYLIIWFKRNVQTI